MKIAIYARVSTDKQETENQLLQLREFASKQDWQIFLEYVDQGVGRPGVLRAERGDSGICAASARLYPATLSV